MHRVHSTSLAGKKPGAEGKEALLADEVPPILTLTLISPAWDQQSIGRLLPNGYRLSIYTK